MLTNDDLKNWDKVLGFAVFAMNTSVPRGFKHSAFQLMFGRNPISPLAVMYDTSFNITSKKDWWEGLIKARKIAAAMDGLTRWETKDKNKINDKLVKGDYVLIKNDNPSKFDSRQFGPFQIVYLDKGKAILKECRTKSIYERDISCLTRYHVKKGDKIVKHNFIPLEIIEEKLDDEMYYLVRWKGFGSESDSWVNSEFLEDYPIILNSWEKISEENKKKN